MNWRQRLADWIDPQGKWHRRAIELENDVLRKRSVRLATELDVLRAMDNQLDEIRRNAEETDARAYATTHRFNERWHYGDMR